MCDCGQIFSISLSTFSLLIAEKSVEIFASCDLNTDGGIVNFHSALVELNTLKKKANKSLCLWETAKSYVASPRSYPVYFFECSSGGDSGLQPPIPLKCLKKRATVSGTGIISVEVPVLHGPDNNACEIQNFFKTEGGKNPKGTFFLSIFPGSMFFLKDLLSSTICKSVSINVCC